MTFWLYQALAVGLSLVLTRGRQIDLWSRLFWGFLTGVGLWLVALRLGGGG